MIKVKKDFDNVPVILKSPNRKEAFGKNIYDGNFNYGKDLYKVGSVQKRLKTIYNLKCAYCEKKLLDTPKHIEHYRPKDIYYWLAYSWDNLLLSCGSCNSFKGTNFEILNNRVIWTDETFENIHNLGDKYDELEEPMIINPEKENILDKISFNKKGFIFTNDKRIQYTIDTCELNREPLCKLREEIMGDFIETMEGHYEFYILKKDISGFIPTVQQFLKNYKIENKFYAFRYFIVNNIELFFDNGKLADVVKIIFLRLNRETL